MALIEHVFWPRTQQPQGAVRPADVDALAFLWTASLPVDAVSGRIPTINAAAYKPTPHGIVAACAAGQQNIEWANHSPVVTSDGNGTGDFALLAVINPVAGGGFAHVVAQKNDAAGAPYRQCGLYANANTAFGSSSTGVAFLVYSSSSSAGVSAAVADGNMHVCIGVRRGTTYEMWVDGNLAASATGAALNIQQANRYLALGSRGNGTTESYARDLLAAAGFNAAPSPAFLARLRRPEDAFALLTSPIRRRLPAGAAQSLPTLSSATYMPGSITSSGFRPRVTAS